MMAKGVRGTVRDRAYVVALVVLGVTLPVVANLGPFQNVAWVFWLAALVLIISALVVLLRANRRDRNSSGT
jgi:hypothetical protein